MTFQKRIDALERQGIADGAASFRVVRVPAELSGGERDAWIAAERERANTDGIANLIVVTRE